MFKKLRIFLIWILFIGGLATAYLAVGGKFVSYSFPEDDIIVKFLQTQNDADCIIISSGEHAVMIDTGEEIDGPSIVKELQESGITTIDYMILTHPDQDHIGGAVEVLENIKTLKVIQSYYQEEKELLQELNEYCENNKISVFYPSHSWKLHTDYINMIVYPPLEKHYRDSNNYSLVVLARHKNINMLFTGDILRKRTEELLLMHLPKIDLYKVPHHGRANIATGKIIEEIQPEIAIITSDSADREVVEGCEKYNTQLLYTDNGTITIISNGNELIKENLSEK